MAQTTKMRLRFGMGRALKVSSCEFFLSLLQDGRLSDYGRCIAKKAYRFAQEAHYLQFRDDGRPYIFHVTETALIGMVECGVWEPRVVALLLNHDVFEMCPNKLWGAFRMFGIGYGMRMLAITRFPGRDRETYLTQIKFSEWEVIFAKLCDRLHNLRNILHMDEDFRIKQVVETHQ